MEKIFRRGSLGIGQKKYLNINSNETEESIHNKGSSTFVVYTKTQGTIVQRLLSIGRDGIGVLDPNTMEEKEFYKFEDIKQFHYGEENCFVMIRLERQEVMWKTSRQATKVRGVIDSYINDRLLEIQQTSSKKKQKSPYMIRFKNQLQI